MAKILIVDDESTIRELFKYVFEDAGHKVELANNGRQALDILRNGIPDFIVLDIAMPEMSGTEFVAELKRRAVQDQRLGNIPFVVMTGEDFMDSGRNNVFMLAPGFAGFFPKMTPPETVLEKVEAVMKNRG
ncbi:MAG: response regulator [Elusimicrobia bacterium]|nr:response regulator [Elusimicrobiota bacterium]